MSDSLRSRQGLLLLNLGTPDSYSPEAVRRYLAEFLMDPLVIDIPAPLRFLLVYCGVLLKRPKTSAEAYRKIWTERGSPLAFHLEDLAKKTTGLLEERGIQVFTAMRYQNPSIHSALHKIRDQGIDELVVFPLYPQYSLAATESSIRKVRTEARRVGFNGKLRFVPAFYDAAPFIDSFVHQGKTESASFSPDYVLYSFHGLPERQVQRTDRSGGHCLKSPDCCERIVEANRDCYRAQCYVGAHAIARGMGFSREEFGTRYGVSFQSRLGRTPWIRPYTDLLVPELAKKGVKRLLVMCPSFVADCLETLEEIQIRARESFIASGGEDLRLVPSLNASEEWGRGVCELMKTAVSHAD